MNSVKYSPRKVGIDELIKDVIALRAEPIITRLKDEFEERFRKALAAIAIDVANAIQVNITKDPLHFGDYVEISVLLTEAKPLSEVSKDEHS